MKVTCDVILDLMPLVKDNIASEGSVKLVSEHLRTCESCNCEFESYVFHTRKEVDDKKVLSSIKKKLFLIMSVLLLIGTLISVLFRKETSNLMPTIIAVLGIVITGTLIFKVDIKGDRTMNRFFMGKAIGTIIIFALLGILLILKYVLQLF